MQNKQKDKMISADEAKNKAIEEFHFAGGGEYQPLTVYAESREEAEKLWKEKRTKVEANQIIN